MMCKTPTLLDGIYEAYSRFGEYQRQRHFIPVALLKVSLATLGLLSRWCFQDVSRDIGHMIACQ